MHFDSISSALGRSSLKEASKFGALVRATRRARKLRVSIVAEKVGIDPKHLGRIERGEKNPSFELIIKLSDVMSVSPAAFFDFDEVLHDEKALKATIRQLLYKQDLEYLRRALRTLRVIIR